MKLLKELQSKSWITSTGNKTSARFAIFECQYCMASVELPRAKGIGQKSCGSIECKRKANIDGYNRKLSANNKGNTKDNRSNKPYYSAIKELYRIHAGELIKIDISSFDDFYSIAYNNYVNARKTGSKIKTIINNNGINFISKLNESKTIKKNKYNDKDKLVHVAKNKFNNKIDALMKKSKEYSLKKENDNSRILSLYKYSTVLLSSETLIGHQTIVNKIKKLKEKQVEEFKNFLFNTISIDNRQHIYELTKKQYTLLKSILSNNIKNISTSIYIIKSQIHDEYKIGITNDVNKRFRSILSMSPLSSKLELIYSKNVGIIASKLETNIHKKLKNKNMHSHFEWFNLNEQTLSTVINTIENYKIFINNIQDEELKLKLKKEQEKIQQLIENEKQKFKLELKRIEKLQSTKEQEVNSDINILKEHLLSIKNIQDAKKNIKLKQQIKKDQEKNKLAEFTKRTDYSQAIKHNMTGTKEYILWQSMKQRAKKDNLKIEESWINSFDSWFLDTKDMYDPDKEMHMKTRTSGYTVGNIEFISKTKARQKTHSKSVKRIDTSGSSITYTSAKEASECTDKASAGHITATCQGKRKTHAGYKWEYA